MPKDRRNSLNFLRFAAASFVIFSHGQILAGDTPTMVMGVPLATFSVMIFFTISGYLITDSWERKPSLLAYFASRALRIFPALIVVVVFSAIVLGAAVTTMRLADYFAHPGFWLYFRNIWLWAVYPLPNVFEQNHFPDAVNGSLWSLAPEFFCYIMVAIVGLLAPRTIRPFVYVVLFAIAAAAALYKQQYHGPQIVFYASDVLIDATVIVFFMSAAVIRLFPIALDWRVATALVAAYLVLPADAAMPTVAIYMWISIPYIVLTFGLIPIPILRDLGKSNDLSYGLYLYGFPIEQMLCHVTGGKISSLAMIAAAFALTLVCAFLSWRLVEKPCLSLRRWRNDHQNPDAEMPRVSKIAITDVRTTMHRL